MCSFFKFFTFLFVILESSTLIAHEGGHSNEMPEKDRLSYAQGVYVAELIVKQIRRQEEIGVEINKEEFISGFSDEILGQVALSDSEIIKLNKVLHRKIQINNLKEQAKYGLKNLDDGVVFLENNLKKKEVKETGSTLQYEILQDGHGRKPSVNESVDLYFKISRIDGSVVKSMNQEPVSVSLGSMVKGFREGVLLMSEGARYEFYIPSKLAYGLAGDYGFKIGPNETLIYQVELIRVKSI